MPWPLHLLALEHSEADSSDVEVAASAPPRAPREAHSVEDASAPLVAQHEAQSAEDAFDEDPFGFMSMDM